MLTAAESQSAWKIEVTYVTWFENVGSDDATVNEQKYVVRRCCERSIPPGPCASGSKPLCPGPTAGCPSLHPVSIGFNLAAKPASCFCAAPTSAIVNIGRHLTPMES